MAYVSAASGVAWLVFLAWFFTSVLSYEPTRSRGLLVPMLVASIWILVGAPLMAFGEHNLTALLETWDLEGSEGGWAMDEIQAALHRADRAYRVFAVAGVVLPPVALLTSRQELAAYLPIGGWVNLLLGIAVVSFVGWVSMSGAWGAMKAMRVQRAATRSGPTVWQPFHPRQQAGVEELYRFAWRTGIVFSVGATFAPAIVVVALDESLAMTTRAILWLFVAILTFGGLLLFTFPIAWLAAMTRRQKERELETIADSIDPLRRAAVTGLPFDEDTYHRLRALVLLRQGTVAETAAPYNVAVLGRGLTTLLIPLAGIVIPVFIELSKRP